MDDEFQGTVLKRNNPQKLDFYDRIIESKEEVKKLKEKYKGDFLKHIHCNGCYKKCSITNASCGRGKSTYKFYIENEK